MSPELLAASRAAQLQQLEETGAVAVILNPTESQNDYGEPIRVFAPSGNSYPCMVQEAKSGAGGVSKTVADRQATTDFWNIIMPWDAEVNDSDRIIVGSETYEVIEVPTERTNRQTLTVSCVKTG
jgi:head-tail adaptor